MWDIIKRTGRIWWEVTKRIFAFPFILCIVFVFLPFHIICETFEMYHTIFDKDKIGREKREE
jgi:hypothetical protein